MDEFVGGWLDRMHPYLVHYGFWFLLVALFLKHLIFLGPFTPGAIALVIAGSLARHGQGSPVLLALAGFIGTLGGDTASYFIGRKAGDCLLRSKRWGKAVTAVSERVRNEPALFVFEHFETFLTMVVPATAGMSGVPFRRWFVLSAVGAALWVAAYGGAGYFLSAAGAMAAGKTIAIGAICLLILFIFGRHLPGWFSRQTKKPGNAAHGV